MILVIRFLWLVMRMLNKLKFEVFGEKRDTEIFSEPGERMVQTYREKIDENGIKVLEPDNLFDIQEEIQSYEESVNVNNIIARYVAGDESALDRAKAFYADVSKVPKNMAAILDLNSRAKKEFGMLPSEVQAMYGFNYMEFLNHPEILDDYIQKNYIEHAPAPEVKDVQDEKPID